MVFEASVAPEISMLKRRRVWAAVRHDDDDEDDEEEDDDDDLDIFPFNEDCGYEGGLSSCQYWPQPGHVFQLTNILKWSANSALPILRFFTVNAFPEMFWSNRWIIFVAAIHPSVGSSLCLYGRPKKSRKNRTYVKRMTVKFIAGWWAKRMIHCQK